MHTRILDQEGNEIRCGRQIGRKGGEGATYDAISHPGQVIKIYHALPSKDQAEKLWYLVHVGKSNPQLPKFAAWPTSVAWKDGQIPCGFLMPFVKGKEIHQLFAPGERLLEFPSANWDFLIHVARNCAAAFDSIHSLGIVIGDVNEGNILVSDDGFVRLIDCDSYQVSYKGRIWSCDVGVPLWTAPELQGKNFRGMHRTQNHDCFGLAVMIFKLLFMGRHPYAGIPLHGSSDFVIEKAIANYMFAFATNASALGLRPPPHSLPLYSFPQTYVDRFEQAFMRGSETTRPIAQNWAQAMEALFNNLAKCGRDPSHKYPRNLMRCPWCEIVASGGPNFFVSVIIAQSGNRINASELWAAIASVEQITVSPRRIEEFKHEIFAGSPLPHNMQKIRPQFIFGWILIVFSLFLLFTSAIGAGIICAFISWGLLANGAKTQEFKNEQRRRQQALDQADREIQQLLHEATIVPGQYAVNFSNRRAELRVIYDRYIHLDREQMAEMKKLEQKKRDFQLKDFLLRKMIRNAIIPGIGDGRKDTLQAYGVETAWDVTPRMNVPGIGEAFTLRLLQWRRQCEGRFSYNASAPIPVQEVHELNVRINMIRNNLMSDLKQGPQSLMNIWASAKSQIAQIEYQLQEAITRRAKCHADLRFVQN